MSSRFKVCRCGSSIPIEWPECHECLIQGVALKGRRRTARLQRVIPIGQHVRTASEMRKILSRHRSDPTNQAAKILATRAAGKKRQADRAGEALKQWMAAEA